MPLPPRHRRSLPVPLSMKAAPLLPAPRWLAAGALMLALGCQHKGPPPPPPKPPALPAPKKSQATLFDHAMLAGLPARPRPDCSPEALMAAARHVGELQMLASGTFPSRKTKGKPAGCPSPEGQLALDEVKGALPERVSSCMSQDAPFDAEWDMVNSAVIALGDCLDCARPKDERTARCRWVADQVKRAEQSVKGRLGK